MDIRSLVTRLGYKVDTKGLKKGEKAITRYARNVKRIAVASIAAVGVAVLGIGVASVKTAAEMESINAAFEVMTGSASVAKKMMEDITKMSLKTPFDFMDLAKTAEQMLNANIAVEDIMGNLQMLGDVAGKDKERLKSLTRAFGQISQATRLNGEDLNQLIDAGFNPLLVIGEKTGKTYTQLRKEMSKGLISAAQVKDAFRTVTSEGGRFYKNMEAQNKTMGGQWGMFLGLIKQVRAEIGKKLSPVIIKALRWANRIILTKLIPTTKKWLDSMRPMLDYVDYIAATLRALPGILKAIKVAFGPEISGLKKMLKLVASITLEYHKLLLNILKSEAFLKTVGWLFQRIYNILSVTIKGWLRLFQLLDHVLKQLNRSAAEKHEARQRNVSKIMSDLFTRKEGFSTDKEGVSSRRGKTLDLAGLQKFFADR
ncbi:MAG: tape measure protein, partial [Deltaproteobacteria bacterium]|nr:tape measure protein [Deltaproteobacteria bacterium]